MYLFELWFSPDTCLGAGLLGHTVILGFPGCASGKEHTCKYRRQRDMGSTLGSGRSGGGHDNPFQYSCLGNPKDIGAWQATVHGVTKQLNTNYWLKQQQSVYVNPNISIYSPAHLFPLVIMRRSLWCLWCFLSSWRDYLYLFKTRDEVHPCHGHCFVLFIIE